MTSVARADFVPLTVAGQRWSYTIFPDCRVALQYNLASDPIQLQVDRIAAAHALSSLHIRAYLPLAGLPFRFPVYATSRVSHHPDC